MLLSTQVEWLLRGLTNRISWEQYTNMLFVLYAKIPLYVSNIVTECVSGKEISNAFLSF